MPTAIIADDEDLALGDLKAMLAEAWPGLSVVAECEDGTSALEAIVKYEPDVVFLDIRMPGMTGLDVAQAAAGKSQVVFTTAYDNHAINAFNLGAIDYLLKPLTLPRLVQAVERLQERIDKKIASPELIRMMTELDKRLSESRHAERIRWISASVGDTIHMFPIEEVLFFESDLKYTRVVTATNEAHVRLSLRELEQGLDMEEFWQIHRGTVVRASAIACARRDDLGGITIELRGHEERLKVSRAYAWRFKGM